MSKKIKKSTASSFGTRQLSQMNYKDLQRACVARGMDFQEVVESSVLDLHSWFNQNYQRGQDLKLIDGFDDWKEGEIKKTGKYKNDSAIFHPDLRLGFIGKKDSNGNIEKTKKPRLIGLDKKVKEKKERIEGTKVISGSKKGLTYALTKQGNLSISQIIEKVKEDFPEANEKSVEIWFKRAKKEFKI